MEISHTIPLVALPAVQCIPPNPPPISTHCLCVSLMETLKCPFPLLLGCSRLFAEKRIKADIIFGLARSLARSLRPVSLHHPSPLVSFLFSPCPLSKGSEFCDFFFLRFGAFAYFAVVMILQQCDGFKMEYQLSGGGGCGGGAKAGSHLGQTSSLFIYIYIFMFIYTCTLATFISSLGRCLIHFFSWIAANWEEDLVYIYCYI